MRLLDILRHQIPNSLNIVALALPISIGYGILSGLGAITGIVGLLVSLLLGSFMGGVKDLIRTPTAVTTLVVAFAVGEMEGSFAEKMQLSIFIFVFSGLLLTIIGKFDLARFVKLMPYPLVKGVTITIGILLIVKSTGDIIDFGQLNSFASLPSILLALSVILIVVLLERFSGKLPSFFIAIILPSFICYFFDLKFETHDLNLNYQQQFFSWSTFLQIAPMTLIKQFPTVVFIALYAALSSSLCVLILDGLTDEKYNLNKEIFDLGIINAIAGFLGGIPSCGNLPASLVNIHSTNSSRYVGVFAAIFLMLFLLLFSHTISYIPDIVISAILFYLGFKLIDFRLLKSMVSLKHSDHIVLLVTLLIGIFDSLFNAIIAGFTVSSIMFMHKMRKMNDRLTVSGDIDQLVKRNKFPKTLTDRIQIIHLNGPLFFGSAEDFYNKFLNLQRSSIIIVNLKEVPFTDETGLNVIKKSINKALDGNVTIYFTGANYKIYRQFERYGVVNERLTENSFYPSINSCLKMLKSTAVTD